MKNIARKYVRLSFHFLLLSCTWSMDCWAQEAIQAGKSAQITATPRRYGLDANKPLLQRVGKTSHSALAFFRNAGMSPKPFTLNEQDQQKLIEAISIPPPLHQTVLKQRLGSISFVTDMPNTVLSSPVNPEEPHGLFNITVRAGGILNQSARRGTDNQRNTALCTIHLLRMSMNPLTAT